MGGFVPHRKCYCGYSVAYKPNQDRYVGRPVVRKVSYKPAVGFECRYRYMARWFSLEIYFSQGYRTCSFGEFSSANLRYQVATIAVGQRIYPSWQRRRIPFATFSAGRPVTAPFGSTAVTFSACRTVLVGLDDMRRKPIRRCGVSSAHSHRVPRAHDVPSVRRSHRTPSAGMNSQVLLGLIGVGAIAVLALWWRDPPAITGFGDWLTNAGRVTGLLAGYVIAILLLLMARVPAIERGVGADRLARWHSMGGRYAVSLSLAHALLVIWGYSVIAHESVAPQTWQLLTRYPDVLMATVALGLLVMIGVVSARAARKRLRYETWYFLHFYTYLAIGLSFAHVLVGPDFAADPPARFGWSALYGSVGALLLWYRFVVPVRAALRHRLVVDAVIPEGPGVHSIHVRGRHLLELGAEPGQFFRWRFLTRDGWWQSHPYSLSAPATDSLMRFTVKGLGDHSGELQHVRKGTKIFAEGPYGALTAARRAKPKVLLLAGGIGVTPLRSLFERMPAAAGDLTLLYRANSELDVIFRTELQAISARRGARVIYLIGPHAGENDPLPGRRLAGILPDICDHDVYVCGPPRMMDAAQAALRRVGVPNRQVHTESFEF